MTKMPIVTSDTDTDETRRLCYMALLVRRTEHHDLAGTLVNALRHHQGVDDPHLEDRVVGAIEGSGNNQDDEFIRDQITRLTGS